MTPLHSVVLGAVQGLAEFLPISSSAHLLLVPWLLGWPEHTLTYDVALHMGTLAALLVYFWRDWWTLATVWLPPALVVARQIPPEGRASKRRLGIRLAIATVPAALAGYLFAESIESVLREPWVTGLTLIGAAVLLAAADRTGRQTVQIDGLGYGQAAVIGIAQALALAPGISRSGITLAAALFLGMSRESGARFGFLLAAPVTAGAGLFQLRHLFAAGLPPDERTAFLVGISTSLVVGLLAIGGLLRYVRTRNLDVFVGYRLLLGVVVLVVSALRWR